MNSKLPEQGTPQVIPQSGEIGQIWGVWESQQDQASHKQLDATYIFTTRSLSSQSCLVTNSFTLTRPTQCKDTTNESC